MVEQERLYYKTVKDFTEVISLFCFVLKLKNLRKILNFILQDTGTNVNITTAKNYSYYSID